jgi:serine/threonine protein kinase
VKSSKLGCGPTETQLLDFGASRRVMGEMSVTLTGVVKKGYSPQEQYATDGRSQGPWTDIYSLAATLYRCISGETLKEATQRILDDRYVSAVEIGGDRYRRYGHWVGGAW